MSIINSTFKIAGRNLTLTLDRSTNFVSLWATDPHPECIQGFDHDEPENAVVCFEQVSDVLQAVEKLEQPLTKFALALHETFDRTATPENVDLALQLIAGEIDPLENEAAKRLMRECYGRPTYHHLLVTALNSLLGTCGVEYIGEVDYTRGPPVEYLNTGDQYAATLVWYRSSGRFYVKSWEEGVAHAERNP